jgi:TrmH family RNA methyltransferase
MAYYLTQQLGYTFIVLYHLFFVTCREIYRFRESSQDKNVTMDCLILPEKAEIPNGLDESTDSIVHVSSVVMRKLSGLESTDSIEAIALMKIPASFLNLDDNQKHCKKWFPSAHRILVLDGIQVMSLHFQW